MWMMTSNARCVVIETARHMCDCKNRPHSWIFLIPIFLTIHLVSSIPLKAGCLTGNQWFLEPFSALAQGQPPPTTRGLAG